jgi:hypothetical protein
MAYHTGDVAVGWGTAPAETPTIAAAAAPTQHSESSANRSMATFSVGRDIEPADS